MQVAPGAPAPRYSIEDATDVTLQQSTATHLTAHWVHMHAEELASVDHGIATSWQARPRPCLYFGRILRHLHACPPRPRSSLVPRLSKFAAIAALGCGALRGYVGRWAIPLPLEAAGAGDGAAAGGGRGGVVPAAAAVA